MFLCLSNIYAAGGTINLLIYFSAEKMKNLLNMGEVGEFRLFAGEKCSVFILL